MTEKRTSIFENGLIWFGAGVSLAEILTGTYFASLGFGKGLLAIIIGHIIGCTMLFLAGVIGGKTRRSAMETVKMSFGEKGWLDCHYDLRRSSGRKRCVTYRKLGMVSGNRCTDRTVDFYRHHKPWKNQHHRYGSTFYPHTGTLQAHLL